MKKILIILGIIILFITLNKILLNQKIDGEISMLINESSKTLPETVSFKDFKGLPEPVQRYFQYTLKEGQEYIRFVRLKQDGEFRMKENQPWMPIKAEQYFATESPAFLWRVKLNMLPLVWIEGRDMYYQGKGNMLIKLLSTITLADATGNEIDVSSLIRFLSEAVWFPTALLPGDYLEWNKIDTNTARAIIKYESYTASGVFTFNEKGEIIKFVSNDRYMESDGKYYQQQWTGYYRNYQEIEGIKIPTEGEVEWNLPDRNLPYARLKITEIQYNIMEKY